MAPESARKEEIRQALLVIGSVLSLFLLITGLALFFNQGTGSPLASPPSKRFTAKSGTTRERAVALVSRNQTARINATDSTQQQEEKQRRIRARMLSEVEENRPLTETQRKIREALNTLDPDEGLRKLQSLLEQARDDGERSDIYAAMSELYLQRDTPDTVAAEKMLDAALSAAPDAATRARLLLRQAELCAARGMPQMALAKIQTELKRLGGGMDAATLPLLTARGFLLEVQGNVAEAEAAYRDALQRADAAGDVEEISASVRDAGMRLTRLLREHQRDTEADEIARRVSALTGNSLSTLLQTAGGPGKSSPDLSSSESGEKPEPDGQAGSSGRPDQNLAVGE